MPRTGQLPWLPTVTLKVLGIVSFTVVTVVPATSSLPLAVTPSIEVPMLPPVQGLTEPASRTDWIHRPLLFGSGLASSGESPRPNPRWRRR